MIIEEISPNFIINLKEASAIAFPSNKNSYAGGTGRSGMRRLRTETRFFPQIKMASDTAWFDDVLWFDEIEKKGGYARFIQFIETGYFDCPQIETQDPGSDLTVFFNELTHFPSQNLKMFYLGLAGKPQEGLKESESVLERVHFLQEKWSYFSPDDSSLMFLYKPAITEFLHQEERKANLARGLNMLALGDKELAIKSFSAAGARWTPCDFDDILLIKALEKKLGHTFMSEKGFSDPFSPRIINSSSDDSLGSDSSLEETNDYFDLESESIYFFGLGKYKEALEKLEASTYKDHPDLRRIRIYCHAMLDQFDQAFELNKGEYLDLPKILFIKEDLTGMKKTIDQCGFEEENLINFGPWLLALRCEEIQQHKSSYKEIRP